VTTSTRSRTLVLAALVLALPSLAAKKEPRAPAPVPVLAAAAATRSMASTLGAVGAVEPIETVTVRAQITGVVTQIGFKEGQDVRAGQLLFQIDPRPLQASLAAAQAELARNQAEAENARVQADRYARLVEQDFVTKEQAEEARTRAASLAAAVAADEAAVEQARLDLAYASVKAPISGRTGSILVTRGNVARANETSLVVINQLQPIRVNFAVPGARLDEIRRHHAAGDLEVRVNPARGGEEPALTGRLSFVDNAVAPATGTVVLKAEFPNTDDRLWPGQFVDVELVLSIDPAALAVPASAVVTSQEGPFVYVVGADKKVEKRLVTVGRTTDGFTQIAAGIVAGDTVVTDGQLRLVPGATVEIKPGLGPK
jgi:membrane fusion protein, multidrug efflux system